jgi:hypothetical protein
MRRSILFTLALLLPATVFGQALYHLDEPDLPADVQRPAHDALGKQEGRIVGAKSVPGHQGRALHFDGGNDFVFVPRTVFNHFQNTAYVEAWIRPAAYPTGPRGCAATIFRKRADNNDWGLTLQPNGALACNIYGSNGDAAGTSGGNAPVGAWTSVACYYDGSRLHLLVNSREVGTDAKQLTLDWTTGYRATQIGNNTTDAGVNCPDYGFHGDIDEVAILPAPQSLSQP